MSQLSSSKLFIRSEVLAVMNFLLTVEDAPKQDRVKQIKRLQTLADQETVQKVLVKELQRAGHTHQIQVATELLMELGSIDVLQAPLWALIEDPATPDEVKDAANLILRQLGDQTDPNLYLDYLDDPAGLISRETERMLEVSTRNPEALVDFLDFIFSLPVDEQVSLLASLQQDYPPEYLLSLYTAAMEANPPLESKELILSALGQIRLPQSALFLHDWLQTNPEDDLDPKLRKAVRKAVNELRLAGLYREEAFETYRREQLPHPVTESAKLYQCFATIPDGIGNQGIVVSREKENGDIIMMSVAVNDLHGIIDCFGFYELGRSDFHKIAEKFHEESTKIHTPPEYCKAVLQRAENLNRQHRFRIPYEYTCWKVLMDDVSGDDLQLAARCREWAKPEWTPATANLYQHPDFNTWFLEEGDHPVVTDVMQSVAAWCTEWLAGGADIAEGARAMDGFAEEVVTRLLQTGWRETLIHRLANAAYLLHQQKASTFCTLAATTAVNLQEWPENLRYDGFIRQYGRRCIEEDLLRLQQDQYPQNARFAELAETVLEDWKTE